MSISEITSGPSVGSSAGRLVLRQRRDTGVDAKGHNGREQRRGRLRSRLARWYLVAGRTDVGHSIEHSAVHDPTAALGRDGLVYADALYNVARYLTRNTSDAEDLVQETYARAMRAANQFTPGTNLKAWLFCILRNTFISLQRLKRYNLPIGGLDSVARTMLDDAHHDWLRDDLELDRLRQIVREDIERALLTLSEPARTVILLDLEGLTEAEVAQVVGCAVGTVKSRLARARAALRQQLRDYGK